MISKQDIFDSILSGEPINVITPIDLFRYDLLDLNKCYMTGINGDRPHIQLRFRIQLKYPIIVYLLQGESPHISINNNLPLRGFRPGSNVLKLVGDMHYYLWFDEVCIEQTAPSLLSKSHYEH